MDKSKKNRIAVNLGMCIGIASFVVLIVFLDIFLSPDGHEVSTNLCSFQKGDSVIVFPPHSAGYAGVVLTNDSVNEVINIRSLSEGYLSAYKYSFFKTSPSTRYEIKRLEINTK